MEGNSFESFKEFVERRRLFFLIKVAKRDRCSDKDPKEQY